VAKNYMIRNQTPCEIELRGPGHVPEHVLKLAPLQRRSVGDHPVTLFGPAATQARSEHAIEWEAEPVRSARLLGAAWLVAFGASAAVAGFLARLVTDRTAFLWLGIALLLAGWNGAGAVIALGRPTTEERKAALAPGIDPVPVRGAIWELARDFLIAASRGLVMVCMVLVAVAAPALAIYYGTELSDVITFDGWDHVSLVQGPDAQYVVVARAAQLVLLVLVSLVPALMYFQFDREKLTTLVDRWLHAIFRLDPSVRTVADVDAKYRRRLRSRSPIIMATLLIAVGWIVVLLNADRQPGRLPTLRDLFTPTPTPMTLAFLGAYFLSIQVVLRGYVRGDLKPKTYNVITVRILMALILAWTVQALWGTGDVVLALSFLAGMTPNTVLRWIREVPGARGGKAGDDGLEPRSPLTQLDDIDVYERTRLEEEGITSTQALARHDLIDLILSSRIPVPRLIDWVDQAILQQHAPNQVVAALRRHGIRTATDFLRICQRADGVAPLTMDDASDAMTSCDPAAHPELLRTVLEDDEWLNYITHWRDNDGTEPGPSRVYRTDWPPPEGIATAA
jgi:hypothetical protein